MSSIRLWTRISATGRMGLCRSAKAVKRELQTRVQVKQGTVIGCEGVLPNGKAYQYFRGIPYAEPPLGELRFEAPVPLQAFASPEIDCSKEGDVPLQKHISKGHIIGSENCLFLNVYAPNTETSAPLPVIVFIHGGSYQFGDGNGFLYTPHYLIQEDVIVVTMNYRLGALGFFSLPKGGIQGNMGLKDQSLVLQWVKENIREFNGDPNNVTLMGESAGSASVHSHLHSRNSKKLFHKAILQSGTSCNPMCEQLRPSEKVIKLAKILGCSSDEPLEVVKFLKNHKDPNDFIKYLPNVLDSDEIRRGWSIAIQPVVESDGPDAVITEEPLTAMNTPDSVDIPVMMGYTSAEGSTFIPDARRDMSAYENDLARLLPRNINLHPDDPRCLEVAQKVREFYFKGGKVDESSLNSLADVFGDVYFIIHIIVAAEVHSKKQPRSPLYFYRFDYCGGLNRYKHLLGLKHLRGACHADELFYLFQSGLAKEPWDQRDKSMVEKMCKLWTNFAKHGNPTPDKNDCFVDCTWEQVPKIAEDKEFKLNAFIIDEKQRMAENLEGDRVDFWREIYKAYNGTWAKL